MQPYVSVLAALAVVAVTASASADPRGKVVTLKPVEIIGKRIAPIASIDVSKASATVAPTELKKQLVDRIDESVHSTAL